jgi:hypothetical protein
MNIMKHSREYLKTVFTFTCLTICVTRPNVLTGHYVVNKNQLSQSRNNWLLNRCVPEFDSIKSRTPDSPIDQ